MKTIKKLSTLLLFNLAMLFLVQNAFAQQKQQQIQVLFENDLESFQKKVELIDISNGKIIRVKDGIYTINTKEQNGKIIVQSGVIDGKVVVANFSDEEERKQGSHFKSIYTIEKSLVIQYDVFEDSLLIIKVHRDKDKLVGKEYKSGKISSEGWISLKEDATKGLGITKRYDQNGTLKEVQDDINKTYTTYYPNGNKKWQMSNGAYNSYEENGNLEKRQYKINGVSYVDEYKNQQLYCRITEKPDKTLVYQYYENGKPSKKEIVKKVNGEERVFTYGKSGKLISNEPYNVVTVKQATADAVGVQAEIIPDTTTEESQNEIRKEGGKIHLKNTSD